MIQVGPSQCHPAQLICFKRTKFIYPTPLKGLNYTSGKRGSFIFVETRKKLSEMNFNSIQELSLYVSLTISERSFRFRISITIFFFLNSSIIAADFLCVSKMPSLRRPLQIISHSQSLCSLRSTYNSYFE